MCDEDDDIDDDDNGGEDGKSNVSDGAYDNALANDVSVGDDVFDSDDNESKMHLPRSLHSPLDSAA